MSISKIELGRNFDSLFESSNVSEQQTPQKAVEELKVKIKTLKDERNTHDQRIKTIDLELAKLEEELSALIKQNRAKKIAELESEYTQHEQRLEEIKNELESLKA